MRGGLKRLAALTGVLAATGVSFALVVRPWYLSWGATAEETRRTLPGDEIVTGPATQETRAITIDRPAAEVWPWIAQLGQDRGGFYSYAVLENLVGCAMPSSDRLRPDKQEWQLGDKLWMYPETKAGGAGFATLRVYQPGRALGFGTRMVGTNLDEPENGSWSFVLTPIDSGSSRLLVRGRGTAGRSLLGATFDRSIFEPVHFVMERRMMEGIKEAAEGRIHSTAREDLEAVLWVITFALVWVAAVLVFRRPRWLRALAGFAAALAVFQILTLVQPHPVVGVALISVLLWILWGNPAAVRGVSAGYAAGTAVKNRLMS